MKQRTNFLVDKQGSYIHWPFYDIHLDFESLQAFIDPAMLVKMKLKSFNYDRSYGQAMALIRKESGLKQSDIKGLTSRHISQIENGQIRPSVYALTILGKAHKGHFPS